MPIIHFKGKAYVQNHHLSVKYHQLEMVQENSLNEKPHLQDNLIVQGDNLLAMKALLPNYAGKVKCIYIDPPYNTGNESWTYNDNVNSPMILEWIGKTVDSEDQSRHDKWLCMMLPRLKMMRELLSDEGVIFISIDDNEVHRLRMLLDEIFGEENFIAQIVWRRTDNQANIGKFAKVKEYILLFCKDIQKVKISKMNLTDRAVKEYRYTDEKGRFRRAILLDKTRGRHEYTITTPSGKTLTGTWMVKEEEFLRKSQENEIYWTRGGDEQPYGKIYLEESDGQIPNDFLGIEFGTNQEGSLEVEKIFGNRVWDFPKPINLVKHFIRIGTSNPDDIVLDAFAGSGTTGQAVLELNHEDGGNRQFIMIEQGDHANSITAERIRKVLESKVIFAENKPSFSFFKVGTEINQSTLLKGENMPSYSELARFVYFNATGENFDEAKMDLARNFIGKNKEYEIFLYYEPQIDKLRQIAFTLSDAQTLGTPNGRRRLVFAPMKHLDSEFLQEQKIDFCHLPFEIYKFRT